MGQATDNRKPTRRDRMIRERVHDPYAMRQKPAEDSLCPTCGSVYRGGRWTWAEAPSDPAKSLLCPACHRISDGYPAGTVVLSGGFLAEHRTEIVNLARNVEENEKGEHPLHRIMSIKDVDGGLEILTTDIHLPRRIGEAIHRAYEGKMELKYVRDEYAIRVAWVRES